MEQEQRREKLGGIIKVLLCLHGYPIPITNIIFIYFLSQTLEIQSFH